MNGTRKAGRKFGLFCWHFKSKIDINVIRGLWCASPTRRPFWSPIFGVCLLVYDWISWVSSASDEPVAKNHSSMESWNHKILVWCVALLPLHKFCCTPPTLYLSASAERCRTFRPERLGWNGKEWSDVFPSMRLNLNLVSSVWSSIHSMNEPQQVLF
jgi:hypothetical protein